MAARWARRNSVAFQFERKGVLRFPAAAADADAMLEAAIEAGAEDVDSDEDGHEVTRSVEDFVAVRDALEARFGQAEIAQAGMVAGHHRRPRRGARARGAEAGRCAGRP